VTSAQSRCMLIGHHALLLDCLQHLLEPEFKVLATDTDLDCALKAAARFRPNIAVIDLDAGDVGFSIGCQLCKAHPRTTITYLSSESSQGGEAFSKTRSASELLRVLQADGQSEQAFRGGTGAFVASPGAVDAPAVLSPREREVLSLLVRGLSMKEAARKLGLTARTVAFHKYHAMQANGLRNNADLITFALHHGILPPQQHPDS